MKIVKRLLGLAVFAYLIMASMLFVNQRNLLYFPTEKYPHDLRVENFVNEGVRIEVVVINQGRDESSEENKPAILYFGGNGESVAYSATAIAKSFPEHTLYFVNYRGYGGSDGEPTEKGLYSDAHYIYDRLGKRHEKISVVGRSLGSGVATYLAATRVIEKMVLITPYDSIQHVAQDQFPFFPMSILLLDKYDSVSRVKVIDAQTLVIVAERDEIIPAKFSTRLVEAFPSEQVVVKSIAGASHNNLSKTEEYYRHLRNFM